MRLGKGLRLPSWIPLTLLMIAVTVVTFFPIYSLVITSLTRASDMTAFSVSGVPQRFTVRHYITILSLSMSQFPLYYKNSLIAAFTSSLIAVVFGVLAGYSLARFKFRFKRGLFFSLMLTRLIPTVALSLPLYRLSMWTGLHDSLLGLIVVYSAMSVPFVAWLVAGFVIEIPKALNESAQLDGCSRVAAFWRIELPIAKPGIAVSWIFAFLLSWNEFAIALVLTATEKSRVLPVGIFDQMRRFQIDWGAMSAEGVLMMIPALIFVALMNKYILRGLTFGAVK